MPRYHMPRYHAVGLLGLALLLAYLYAPVFADLARQWAVDTTFGYGYYIPGVAAYLIWERRGRLARTTPRSSWWGYPLLVLGLAALVLGRAGGIQVSARVSLIPVLFGLALFLGGPEVARLLAFPFTFLALMIPLPADVLQRLSWPLQLFTARFSTDVLHLLGYPVLLQGVYIDLPTIRLEVAEACSGFRSLVALGATGVLLAYLTQDRWTRRALLVAAVIPVAVLANAIRVTVNIAVGIYDGTFHAMAGWMAFLIAVLVLLALATALGRAAKPERSLMRRAAA
jgi:exosortase